MQPPFPMPPSPAHPPSPVFRLARPRRGGFTLIELLTVIGIIGILSGIALGVMRGVSEKSKIAKAKTDMTAVALALTAFKQQYGDFPHIKLQPDQLYDALTGKRGPLQSLVTQGKVFLDFGHLTLEDPDHPTGPNSLLDPWGNKYLYIYKVPPTGWKNPSYILYSSGPDGKERVILNPDGFPNTSDPDNDDNVYPDHD